jgi:hypothetical protein
MPLIQYNFAHFPMSIIMAQLGETGMSGENHASVELRFPDSSPRLVILGYKNRAISVYGVML